MAFQIKGKKPKIQKIHSILHSSNSKNGSKAQSAMEFIMSHGWALVISLSVGFTLWQLGIFSMGSGTMMASGFGQLNPILSGFKTHDVEGTSTGVLSMLFVNAAGQDIQVCDMRVAPLGQDIASLGNEMTTAEYCRGIAVTRDQEDYITLRAETDDCEEVPDGFWETVNYVIGNGDGGDDPPVGNAQASIFPVLSLIEYVSADEPNSPTDECHAEPVETACLQVPAGEPVLLVAADSCGTVGDLGDIGGGKFRYQVSITYKIPFASPGGIEYFDRKSTGTISG
ncbi:MAG: hypothetical protein ABH950_02170 [Candidatus Altiarchaeota archaeon]